MKIYRNREPWIGTIEFCCEKMFDGIMDGRIKISVSDTGSCAVHTGRKIDGAFHEYIRYCPFCGDFVEIIMPD